MIEVLPYSDTGKGIIGSIKDTVTIAVQITKRIESASGFLSIFLNSIYAKKLTAVINSTIAIAVKNEEAIVFFNPARTGFQSITVEIENNPGIS